MNKLTFITTNELVEELVKRSHGIAIVYSNIEDGNQANIKTRWSVTAGMATLIGMVDILKYQMEKQFHDTSRET